MVVVSKVSLVVVVGALVLDVCLVREAYLRATISSPSHHKRRAGDRSKGAADAGEKANFVSSHPRFPKLPPRNVHGEASSDESVASRRKIWDRVAEIEGRPISVRGGSPETAMEQGPLAHDLTGIQNAKVASRFGGGGSGDTPSTMHGNHVLKSSGTTAVDGSDDLRSGRNPWGAHVPRPAPRADPYGGQRVAVVVPYVGRDLPVWWDAFAEQARVNDGLMDWIIFCDEVMFGAVPSGTVHVFPTEIKYCS